MTTDRRIRRPWALVLVLAVVATMLLALRPSGTTMAAWSDEVSVQLPALTAGGVGMSVSGNGSSVRVAVSGDVAGTWRPASVTVSAGDQHLTGTQLAGTVVEYRPADSAGRCPTSGGAPYTAAPDGAETIFPVAGSDRLTGERTLCLTLAPSDKLRVTHGGQHLTVTTTLDGAVPEATWTTAAQWAAEHRLPAAPSVDGLSCGVASWLDWRGAVSWRWANADGLTVSGWEIHRQEGANWVRVDTVEDPTARRWLASDGDYPTGLFGQTYNIRVVAVLGDGTPVASGGTAAVRVVDFIGIRFNVRCA